MLALIAERASGVGYHELVRTLVCEPAGMVDTGFLRSDELPGRAALGYLTADGPRTNVFHLPVLGTGDGGAYTTAADLSAFWDALFAGRIVPPSGWPRWFGPAATWPEESKRYGLGFYLDAADDASGSRGTTPGSRSSASTTRRRARRTR